MRRHHATTTKREVNWGKLSSVAAVLGLAAGCGPAVDPQSAYNGSRHIMETAQAGKAAAVLCKQGDAGAALCPKVMEAFDDISTMAKAINENAEKAGGAK